MGAQELTGGGRAAGAAALDTSYDPFSREPAYVELNRQFVRSLGIGGGIRILDLACGTGTLTQLLLEETPGGASVLGVDLSRTSLALAHRRLFGDGALPEHAARVRLVAATADALPVRDRSADAVLMGNAIHYFKDPGRLLEEVRRVLRPGGLFAFNTSFYAGTFVPGTERFYEEWVKEAFRFLLARDAEERRQGRPGLSRTRGRRGEAPFSRRWPSPAEYSGTLEAHGFAVRSHHLRTALMTWSSFEAIGAYEGCAAALLGGYPVALASEALARSAAPVLQACGRETVPRQWLEMTAIRSGGDAGAGGGDASI
ncbi:MAG TPA: class I SAM-dependent methyltransferase [Candidatus Dormibacteraeota bacterium]|nr:class I SAM-dependent methyltransferase [Candidatus Dormibacteraeota bacterium]